LAIAFCPLLLPIAFGPIHKYKYCILCCCCHCCCNPGGAIPWGTSSAKKCRSRGCCPRRSTRDCLCFSCASRFVCLPFRLSFSDPVLADVAPRIAVLFLMPSSDAVLGCRLLLFQLMPDCQICGGP
jgi:hypothetical protein